MIKLNEKSKPSLSLRLSETVKNAPTIRVFVLYLYFLVWDEIIRY